MAKPRGTDGSLLGSLPWTLSALVFSLAPHVQFLPIWITVTFLGCAGWRLLIESRRRPLPSAWIRALLALGCFLGVLGTYATISGVGPGSALLAVMAALKLLDSLDHELTTGGQKVLPLQMTALALRLSGQPDSAAVVLERAWGMDNRVHTAMFGYLYALAGNDERARGLLERETDVQSASNKLNSACFATSIRIRVYGPANELKLASSLIHQIL